MIFKKVLLDRQRSVPYGTPAKRFVGILYVTLQAVGCRGVFNTQVLKVLLCFLLLFPISYYMFHIIRVQKPIISNFFNCEILITKLFCGIILYR